MELVELPDPEPADGEVVVEVARAGVNFADTHATRNDYLAEQTLPMIPGGEISGRTADGRRVAAILAGALILAPIDAQRSTIALGSAFIIWVGFVLPTLVATLRSRGVGWLAALADAGAWLAAMLLQAAVLQLVGLIRP